MAATRHSRPARPQAVLHVVDRVQLSPHLVRVVVGGDGFAEFNDNDQTDKYAKLLMADPSLDAPFDLEALRANAPERLPRMRTYSVRWVDHAERQLALDFVVHGDEGVAAPWAATAQPGDRLVLSGAGGGYAPDPDADWHLLIGDHSAMPAIAQSLEAMPADARGRVLLQVEHREDRLDLVRPAGVTLTWVDGSSARTDALVTATADLAWPTGTPQAFVHGERESVKLLRRHLTDERGLTRDRMSISAYWAHGRIEDQFQAEKREAVGQI